MCVKTTVQDGGVLIETYWNVNEDNTGSPEIAIAVLIETYWNVNERRYI